MKERQALPYKFATDAQWNSCLFSGFDRELRKSDVILRTPVPFSGNGNEYFTSGGYSPALSSVGEVLWRDAVGSFYRLAISDETLGEETAPSEIAHSTRMVVTHKTIWALSQSGSVCAFDIESLTQILSAKFENDLVLDIAKGRHETVFVLLRRNGRSQIAVLDGSGNILSRQSIDGPQNPTEIVYLKRDGWLVVLSDDRSRLNWFSPDKGQQSFSIQISSIRPGFQVACLGSDNAGRLFLAGKDSLAFGGESHVLTLDREGVLINCIDIQESATGIAGDKKWLVVTTNRGLLKFGLNGADSGNASQVTARLLTPMLVSPQNSESGRWLRAEITVSLPPGSSIEFSYAAIDDADVLDSVSRVSKDSSKSNAQRLKTITELLEPWRRFTFQRQQNQSVQEFQTLSIPLFDVVKPNLWISAALTASTSGNIPVLTKLEVFYPDRGLMENLPSLYKSLGSTSFLRSLVGVLETTTQDLDSRISDMGRNINPTQTSGPWLDFIANWLGLPWDDSLSQEQKHRILMSSSDITGGYGTRLGLEALLECLMPETPRRFRVVDLTADFALTTIGGTSYTGSCLPALLAGLSSHAAVLRNKAILGQARLSCDQQSSDSDWLNGQIRIDINTDSEEQKAWEPWLLRMAESLVPVTARVQIRWLSGHAFHSEIFLDSELKLETVEPPQLGLNTIAGFIHLPENVDLSLKGIDLNSRTTLQ
jgi:phage tail-like protein